MALKQLKPLLDFLYFREDSVKFREIAGTLLWRVRTKGALRHGEAKKLCVEYGFDETSFSVVRGQLEDSGIFDGNGDLSLKVLKKIHDCFIDLLGIKLHDLD